VVAAAALNHVAVAGVRTVNVPVGSAAAPAVPVGPAAAPAVLVIHQGVAELDVLQSDEGSDGDS
jgi:hypothetical protein